jgi:DNA-directed RNA polymerase subunit RPC12/RpoP
MSEVRHDAIMPLKCGACGTEWDEHFSLPMVVDAFVSKSKAVRCPSCGSKKAMMQPRGDFWHNDKVKA